MYLGDRLEDQAFDRAHRLGQILDVNIFKLTIEQTVEDRTSISSTRGACPLIALYGVRYSSVTGE